MSSEDESESNFSESYSDVSSSESEFDDAPKKKVFVWW